MKQFAIYFAAVLLAFSGAAAADPAVAGTTDYTATVTGVVCGACKVHVTEALKTLPGVAQVTFAKGEEANTQKVTFTSDSSALTKEDAVKALGKSADQYAVLSLTKDK